MSLELAVFGGFSSTRSKPSMFFLITNYNIKIFTIRHDFKKQTIQNFLCLQSLNLVKKQIFINLLLHQINFKFQVFDNKFLSVRSIFSHIKFKHGWYRIFFIQHHRCQSHFFTDKVFKFVW